MLRYVRNCLAATLSTGLTLVLANALYEPYEPAEQARRYVSSPQGFMAYDPALGWVNRPDTTSYFARNGLTIEINTNHQGMRYRPIPPKTRYRVAVLGDSVVQGYSTPEGERFTDLLEKTMNIDVLNFGVNGYSVLQSTLMLDQVMETQPDLVILAFTLYNDFTDNVHNNNDYFYRPYATLDERHQLKILGQPVPDYTLATPDRAPAMARYPLFRLFYYTLYDRAPALFSMFFGANQPRPPGEGNFGFTTEMLYNYDPRDAVTQALEINWQLLKIMRDRLATAHIPLVIFAAPTAQDHPATSLEGPAPLQYLRYQAQSLNLPLVAIPGFKPGPSNTYPDDIHWRPETHALTASVLAPVISQFMQSATPH